MLRFVALLAGLSLLAIAPSAHAFCRTTTNATFVPTSAQPCDTTSDKLFWASKCVGYSINRAASSQVSLATATEIVAEAFGEWARHDCSEGGPTCGTGKPSIVARDLGPVDCDQVEHTQGGTNSNVIAFRDGVWPHEGTALALTTVTFKVDGGEIFDVDMEIQSNPAEVKLATGAVAPAGEYDLRSILAHEAGHFLGLAHTERTNTQATMFESYRPGQTFMRDLSPDDICGLCTAYPSTRVAACNDAPRGGLGNKCGGGKDDGGCGCSTPGAQGSGAPWLALLALAVVGSRARKRTVS